jgi:acetolactate synthase-1/2/3 large subunit
MLRVRSGSVVNLDHLRAEGLFADGPPLPTPAVLRAVRETVPDGTVVTTDVGGHRIWSKNAFPAATPETFVTAGSWAGMGVGLPSAIGARLANPDRPVVTLSGDGGLFMCVSELHTAAEYDLDLTVVLFDDADYGVISKSSAVDGDDGVRFDWSPPDWVALAESFGCRARRVETTDDLRDGLAWALDADGPTLLDVVVDPDGPTAVQAAAFETTVDPRAY